MLKHMRDTWKQRVCEALKTLAGRSGTGIPPEHLAQLPVETPPDPGLGDLAFPMFPFARYLKTAPQVIAEEVKKILDAGNPEGGTVSAAGPYINVILDPGILAERVVERVLAQGDEFGRNDVYAGEKVMVEFSCPNTNKPLHLGHLRNDVIGESVSRILKACGAQVMKVNLINDRGIHICKSMLAYKEFGAGSTPETEMKKGDHFVGDFYVRFNEWVREDPSAEDRARELLRKWEAGDPETVDLWKKMNDWALDGIKATYTDTGITFDRIYFESETYRTGKEEILTGLEAGVFYRDDEGTIWVDLTEDGLDRKVLLRGDGTSLYLTQDVGTAVIRYRDWGFSRCIYVVGSEQQYHFRVLFRVLALLGKTWAENLHHLSYGMVNLPEGKMKSREGTVVDADDLYYDLYTLAGNEIREKDREKDLENFDGTAYDVALGALHYFLLQVSPSRDMIFNPSESISFNGNTGPYLQYMGARISSMERKFVEREDEFTGARFRGDLLSTEEERNIVKILAEFPETVEKAGRELNPSGITAYLYRLSRAYSKYYHDHPVLHNEDRNLVVSRMRLSSAVLQVLKNAFEMTCIPFLEKM